MTLEACLPAALRRPDTTIVNLSDGLSGAGVYRVECDGEAFVLKIAPAGQPLDAWHRGLQVLKLAASAELAPRIVHVDETRRAVVSEFVADRSFFALYGNPATRGAALRLLGTTVRRVHQLPVPADADVRDPRAHLDAVWSTLTGRIPVPAFVADAVRRVRDAPAPLRERGLVPCHNDIHPANFVFDGDRLRLLDWDTAGWNDPFYDLAVVAVFLRMDDESCRRLIAAYAASGGESGGEPAGELPARFVYHRRLAAVLAGTNLLDIARQRGYGGASGADVLASTRSLGEFYQRMRAGLVNIAAAEGQWEFGLALVKESVGL